jgi:hypothetical protein
VPVEIAEKLVEDLFDALRLVALTVDRDGTSEDGTTVWRVWDGRPVADHTDASEVVSSSPTVA